ncbi:MAG: helix-turn-helix domain-containing protein [Candidatus Limnocylindrales bacterium]
MNDQRAGAALRAIRIKRRWRQKDLAGKARVSSATISLIERGHLDAVSVPAFRRVTAALDVRAEVNLWLAHGDLDRLLNGGHAALHESMARFFEKLPLWTHAPEVSFAIYSEKGVIDILAFHEPTGSLLVIELKTEFVSLEDLLTTMDVRVRHAARIARDRGWIAKTVSAWIVFAESRTNRRRVAAHSAALRAAYPSDGHAMRSWLLRPSGSAKAISFWTDSEVAAVRQAVGATRRVRLRRDATQSGRAAA